MAESPNSYDEIPYQGGPFRQSHPRHLATMATLFGLEPPNVDCCRVLELGCAEGANLIPVAAAHPESRFLGIDFSERQIAVGRELVERLGLANINLVYGNILDIDDSHGTFDYIVAHGVYSWVPDNVREKLLAICHNHLAPDGIAYVSYNTYPGGRLRQMVRDMMLFHVRGTNNPADYVPEARALLEFLLEAVPESQQVYRAVLEWEQRHVRPFPDHHVRHDSLSEVNDPCYFWQFIERAERHGLQYLAEASFWMMLPRSFPPDVFARLKQMSRSVVEIEQYMDFVRNRYFRETLLCRREIKIGREVSPERVARFYIGSSLRPVSSKPDLSAGCEECFRNPDGSEIRVSRPLSKAALLLLGESWPRNEFFPTLVSRAATLLATNAEADSRAMKCEDVVACENEVQGVAETLMKCYAAGIIEFDVRPTACLNSAGAHPAVAALNRLQARTGNIVTNVRHESIRLDPVQRTLVPHLDGRHDRRQLLDALARSIPGGSTKSDSPAASSTAASPGPHRQLGEQLDAALNALAGAAVLVDPAA